MSLPEPSTPMLKVFKTIEHRLKAAKVHFRTESYRGDAFSILVNVPGEYWEIDVLDDASIDVQIFRAGEVEADPWAAIDLLVKEATEESTERK